MQASQGKHADFYTLFKRETGAIIALKLACTQEDEGASLHRLNSIGFCQFRQLKIFSAWIENNASRMEGQDIVVVSFLIPRV